MLEKLEIEIKVGVRTNRETKKDFNVYKALTKQGKWIDCKFRKEVKPPKENSIIVVEIDKVNVTKNTKYPCLWVAEIVEIKGMKDYYNNLMENAVNDLKEMFGEENVKNSDISFKN